MNVENIINYLEENNLLETLSQKMCYINYSKFRRVHGKSKKADWLEDIELFYTKYHYLDGERIFEEELSIRYDEYDYVGNINSSPITLYKEKPYTKSELIELLKKLSKEKIEFVMRALLLNEDTIQKLLNQTDEFYNQRISKIEKEQEIVELVKSMADMQIALGTMIHIMGSKVTRTDVHNISELTKKAKEYLNQLKEEVKELEEQTTLKLK